VRASAVPTMLALEPIEEMRDYREDDVSGKRLFVTGLASSIDDVRLYLAFEGFGRIVEAHVAKPGLGFVVFDDTPTANDALEAMEGSEVSGKEIKVKRARSYYIRKEEEARMRMQSKEREREEKTKLYASEQKRRLQEAEELAFQQSLVQNKGLAHHLQHFDARAHKQAIAEDMEEEGLMPALRGKVQDMHSVEGLVGGRVRMRAARRGPAQAARRAQAAAVQEANQEQVFVGHAAEEEMRRRAAARQRREAPLSLGSVLAPDSDGRTLSAKDEERIRKQAMIEIMKEGDKLSKTESKNLRPENINIAHLIRQRVEQIRRYEMLRDNKELLEQITFTTSNPTSRCIDPDSEDEHEAAGLGVERFSHARDSEWNVDEEDEDDETQVTETEAELIAMISAQAKIKDEILMKGMKFGPKKEPAAVAVAAAYQQNGFSNNIAAGMSSSKATAHNGAQVPGANGQVSNKVDLNGAAAPPVQKKKGRGRPRKEASERKTYVPTGRPRGRPRKNPE